MIAIPNPPALGLPSRYPRWRKGQAEVVSRLFDLDSRFAALVAPTGSGKSLDYTAYGVAKDLRTLILTSTRNQQTQVFRDFSEIGGWADMRGQSNYVCLADEPNMVSEGPCHAGIQCELRGTTCTYYSAKRQAASHESRVVVSNYAFWLADNAYGDGIGAFDLMVCDEAHDVSDQLATFLSVRITDWECDEIIGSRPSKIISWQSWAREVKGPIEQELDSLHPNPLDRAEVSRARRMRDVLRRLSRLAFSEHPERWVFERQEPNMFVKGAYKWDPINPAEFAESYLFRGTPRVLLVSASIRHKTLQLLGLEKGTYEFIEQKSNFPVARRPVIHVPTAYLNFRTKPSVLKGAWLARIDQIIKQRLDRKGIIHTVSYKRMKFIQENSRYGKLMMSHSGSDKAAGVIAAFKKAKAPAILISPSVTTGLDFPYSECEYQIITKVPFPDQRSAILKARAKQDKEYSHYLTMQTLVQMAGRGMRAADDSCETIIVDDTIKKFLRKYSRFAPQWFLEAVRWKMTLPKPLPKLSSRTPCTP